MFKRFFVAVFVVMCVHACIVAYGDETDGGLKAKEEEISNLEKIATSHPNTQEAANALHRIGFLYQAQKNYDKSTEYYERAISNSTNEAFIARMKWYISQNYLRKKEYSKGIEMLQQIIEKYPKKNIYVAYARYSIASTYHRYIKDYPRAIEEYQKITKEYPDDWWGRLALAKIGEAYTAAKDYEKAVASYEEIIEKYPQSNDAKAAKVYITLIKEYYEKGIKPPTGKELDEMFRKEGLEGKSSMIEE